MPELMADVATPGEAHRLGLAVSQRCALSFLGNCSGRPTADHILKRQWLKTERSRQEIAARNRRIRGKSLADLRLLGVDLDSLLADSDNGWWLCWDGHHVPKDGGRLKIMRVWLPESFERFVERWGLENVAERRFGPLDPPGGRK